MLNKIKTYKYLKELTLFIYMKNEFVRKAVSKDLVVECKKMSKIIQDIFGIELSGIQASKLVAWKAKTSTTRIDEKKLMQILGGKI